MTNDFDLLDEVYLNLYKQADLITLLDSPQTPEEKNERIRRELSPLDFVTIDQTNFICLYFSSATETDNIFVSRSFFHVDYFAKSRSDLKKLSAIVNRTMNQLHFLRTSFYHESSFTKGIFRYCEIFRPLIFA